MASDGAGGTGISREPVISADGRYVAFESMASDLVAGDSNQAFDVFVHDRATGVTERVSVATDGTEGNGESLQPAISGDGRYVAFMSLARNLVEGDTNRAQDVFVHDRQAGTTERVSVAADGSEGNGGSLQPALTPDGRYVAFFSWATNLVAEDTNDVADVFIRELEGGSVERISVRSGGGLANGHSAQPVMSFDGRYVAFYSYASDLVPQDTNGAIDVFVRDREARTTERVSVGAAGREANGSSWWPAISADGRHVAFNSVATNLVPADANGAGDAFVHDRQTGATERVSVAADGSELGGESGRPSISADGRYVAFYTYSTLPGEGSFLLVPHAFVRDRATGSTERVSVADDDSRGNLGGAQPAVSADGRHVAFESLSTNLVPGDDNQVPDVFVRDRGPALGIGGLEAAVGPDQVTVSGWATYSGAVVSGATDPSDDGGAAADVVGGELTEASVVHRPETEDLLVRLRVTSLPGFRSPLGPACIVFVCHPGAPGAAGSVAVVYGLELELAGTRYELRALRLGATGSSPAAPLFALYRCDPSCTETIRLSGGFGTSGEEILVALPLEALGAAGGEALSGLRAFTALGEARPGALHELDEVVLPEEDLSRPELSMAIESAGTPEEGVAFDAAATLSGGAFSGAVDTAGIPPGDYKVWARACLGETCGAAFVRVNL